MHFEEEKLGPEEGKKILLQVELLLELLAHQQPLMCSACIQLLI